MKFGRIVPPINTHRLTESDFRFCVTLFKWRPWRHFTQKSTATWLLNTKRLPRAYATTYASSWSICYAQSVKLPISRNRQAYCPFRVMGSTSAHFVKWAICLRISIPVRYSHCIMEKSLYYNLRQVYNICPIRQLGTFSNAQITK